MAERDGKLRIIRNGVHGARARVDVADAAAGRAPTRCMASPSIRSSRRTISSTCRIRRTGRRGTRSRSRADASRATSSTELAEIFVADAWETSGNLAGHMMFGPDSTLYVTVGDRDRLCCTGVEDNSLRMKAQALDNHVGKTLRLKDDGGVPADNPFVGKAGAKPEIFTYGHRNGYGLAIHPQTGELWQAEIGPMGGDEVNILLAGPQLRMAARLDGTQLHRARWRPISRGPDPAWTTRGCSGCRRSARRASCSTRATSSRTGRTACSSAR